MSKKLAALLLSLALLILNAWPVYAESSSLEDIPAVSAILVEQSTGQILFEKNIHEKLAPASITKIMTMLLVLEEMQKGNLSMDQQLTCSEYASHMGGSEIWLEVGEKMSVDDLFKAVFVASANDASVVFAEHIAGSESEFVKRMNQRAQELGMQDTHFVNCTGFDEDEHYTSAYDITLMARALLEYQDIVQKYTTIWMDTLRGGETELVNTNRLVRFYDGITGLKTGTTDAAGVCLCATATRNGMSLISVVMKCKTSDERNTWSTRLLDYGFGNFELCVPPSVNDQLLPVKVLNGVENFAELYCQYPAGILLKKNGGELSQDLQIVQQLEAPVEQDQIAGKVVVYMDGEFVTDYPVKVKNPVPKMSFLKAIAILLRKTVRMK